MSQMKAPMQMPQLKQHKVWYMTASGEGQLYSVVSLRQLEFLCEGLL